MSLKTDKAQFEAFDRAWKAQWRSKPEGRYDRALILVGLMASLVIGLAGLLGVWG